MSLKGRTLSSIPFLHPAPSFLLPLEPGCGDQLSETMRYCQQPPPTQPGDGRANMA